MPANINVVVGLLGLKKYKTEQNLKGIKDMKKATQRTPQRFDSSFMDYNFS